MDSDSLHIKVKNDGKKKPEKSGLQRDSNRWLGLREYRCYALPTELWSHTLGARSIYWVHISREEWNDVKYIWKNSYLNCGCRSKWRMIIAVSRWKWRMIIAIATMVTTAILIWITSCILHIIWTCLKYCLVCTEVWHSVGSLISYYGDAEDNVDWYPW